MSELRFEPGHFAFADDVEVPEPIGPCNLDIRDSAVPTWDLLELSHYAPYRDGGYNPAFALLATGMESHALARTFAEARRAFLAGVSRNIYYGHEQFILTPRGALTRAFRSQPQWEPGRESACRRVHPDYTLVSAALPARD